MLFGVLLILLCFIAGCIERMPNCFDGRVPCYPHAEIVESMCLRDGCYTELKTDDSEEAVFKYYKGHMSKIGWSIRVERESTPSNSNSKLESFLTLFKDSIGLMIGASTPTDGGKTQIALFMGDTDE